MTKTELFKKLADLLDECEYGDYDELNEWLSENGYTSVKVDSYIEDADDKGYEYVVIYRVDSNPDVDFMHFYFSISSYGGRWDLPQALYEVTPYVTTRYNFVKNWTDDD